MDEKDIHAGILGEEAGILGEEGIDDSDDKVEVGEEEEENEGI